MRMSEFRKLPEDVQAAIMRENPKAQPPLPVTFFLHGFKLKTKNRISTIGAKIGYRRKAMKAFDDAGVPSVWKAPGKRRVTFRRYLGKGEKIFDEGDNLNGAFSGIRDELVKRGWLHDDSPAWIEAIYRQAYCLKDLNEKPGVEITIERCE